MLSASLCSGQTWQTLNVSFDVRSLGCKNTFYVEYCCTLNVVYSSSIAWTKTERMNDTNGWLTAKAFEFVIIRMKRGRWGVQCSVLNILAKMSGWYSIFLFTWNEYRKYKVFQDWIALHFTQHLKDLSYPTIHLEKNVLTEETQNQFG